MHVSQPFYCTHGKNGEQEPLEPSGLEPTVCHINTLVDKSNFSSPWQMEAKKT